MIVLTMTFCRVRGHDLHNDMGQVTDRELAFDEMTKAGAVFFVNDCTDNDVYCVRKVISKQMCTLCFTLEKWSLRK